MKKLLVECIGTFFLVFTIGCASVSNNPNPALAIGAALMIMVYAGGHISGAHYNPAVSLAVFIRGKLDGAMLLQYWVAQLIGGTVGAVGSYLVTGHYEAAVNMQPAYGVSITTSLLAEAVATFALAFVVLNVATAKGTAGNSFYGLAIGFTVFAMAVAVGRYSGGAFNPAVGLGRSLVDNLMGGGNSLTTCWIYVVGPCAGAAVAAYTFKFVNGNE